jgi:hypothetical protein
VVPVPDNLADAQARSAIAVQVVSQESVVSIPSNVNAEAGTNARWGALHEAYHDGTLSSYTVRTAEPDPADRKYLDGQPEAAPQAESHVSMANNQIR